jgi:hypothetical protein
VASILVSGFSHHPVPGLAAPSTPANKFFPIRRGGFEPKRGIRNGKNRSIPGAGCEDFFHENDEVAGQRRPHHWEKLIYRSTSPSSISCVGLEVSASHLSSIRNGIVIGRVTPIRLGQSIHVWEIRIRDTSQPQPRLICHSKLTVSILKR